MMNIFFMANLLLTALFVKSPQIEWMAMSAGRKAKSSSGEIYLRALAGPSLVPSRQGGAKIKCRFTKVEHRALGGGSEVGKTIFGGP